VAGLDPATHVFFDCEPGFGKDVDARVKPGQGGFLCWQLGCEAANEQRRNFADNPALAWE
jgi:hypothetical protein